MMGHFRDINAVIKLEAARMLSSFRALLVFLLFFLSSTLVGSFYINVVRALEQQALSLAEQAGDTGAGDDITKSEAYQKLVEKFVGDSQKAELLGHTPIIVLVSFWLALIFVPFLILFATYDVLARDTEQRTMRFIRPRLSSSSWVLGKFIAQIALLFSVTVLSGAALYTLAAAKLPSFPRVEGAIIFAAFWGRLLAYELGILGLVMAISAAMRTAFSALFIGLLAIVGLWLVHWLVYLKERAEALASIAYLSPFTYRDGLYEPLGAHLWQSLGAYAAFATIGALLSIYWLKEREI